MKVLPHVSLAASLVALPLLTSYAAADDATLTGDWGGARSRLEEQGIKLTGDYVSETMRNFHGGIKKGTRYAQQIRLGARFDLSKLLGTPDAGIVQLTLNDRRGNSASEDLVGNRLPAQEIYGGNYTRLSELSYERTIFTPDLDLKLGFMPMGNDFGGMSVLTNFVNAGFCAHPLSMSGGSGWTNYPTGNWGAELKYRVNPDWLVQTAVFQVNPVTNSRSRYAFRMSTVGTTGMIVPVEAVYTYHGALEGQYKFGAYYDTSNVQKIGQDSKAHGRHGAYVLADQTVWRNDQDGAQTVHLFGQATSTDKATSPFHHWYSVGAVLHKPFAGRDMDTVGVAYGRAVLNSRTRDLQVEAAADLAAANGIDNLDAGEQLIELSYGAQVTKWLTVRPDLQYVIEPGAFYGQNRGNALLAGFQVKATF